jgi:rhodanese-related sulfurtransferase
MKWFQYLLIAVVLAILYFAYRYAMDSPYRVSTEEAKRMIRNHPLILDVRTDLERSTLGYYPGSVHIPSSELTRRMPLEFPDKTIPILAYCNTGQRSRVATEILQGLGYTKARYIATTYTSLM